MLTAINIKLADNYVGYLPKNKSFLCSFN